MKRRKVAQILEATIGGTARHLKILGMRLDRRKFETHVICSVRRTPDFWKDLRELEDSGIRAHIVQMERAIHPWRDLVSLVQIWTILVQEKYDVVHCHSSKAGFLGRLAAWLAGVPLIVYTPHAFSFQAAENPFVKGIYIALEWLAGRWTDRLICVSKGERDYALRYRLMPAERIDVIPNGVDLHEFESYGDMQQKRRELGIPDGDRVVGTVGDLRLQKGHAFLLASVPQVLAHVPNTTFLIVGDGDRRRELEEIVQRLGLDRRVLLVGRRRDVADIYLTMDVYTLPSLWEGMPYTVLEAMACRRPVVATDVVGTHEVLSGGAGILVPPGRPDLLGDTIVRLLQDQSLADHLGACARQRIEEIYLVEQQICRLEAVYERV